ARAGGLRHKTSGLDENAGASCRRRYVMISHNAERSRSLSHNSSRLLPVAALALLLPAAARGQQPQPQPMTPDTNNSIGGLMQHRMEETQRAVNETARRRFEEGKPDGSFPSDANKSSSKAGVVRVASPEEQKALSHN